MNIRNEVPLWINGKEVYTENKFDNADPYTSEIICEVSTPDNFLIEEAIESAEKAQKEWANYSAKKRAKILRKAAHHLEELNDEIALIETIDTGRPIRETSCVDIVSSVDCLNYMASQIETLGSRHQNLGDNQFFFTNNKPLGVCLGIGAWNYPIQIATWKSAPALAMGNSFIFKTSENAPMSALYLAKAYQKAGLPDGLFQVIHGHGEIGSQLVSHPSIKKVSLTGSVETGKKVFQDASLSFKKTSLELGGKGPLIIMEDANLHGAVQSAMLANFYSQGEICSNGTRVFVHENILDRFTSLLKEETQKIIAGDPKNPETHLGPIINKKQVTKIQNFIALAKDEGATVYQPYPQSGNIIPPTILTNCSDHMNCVRHEIFGPVMSVLGFSEKDEVIERANNTNYGLAGAVFSENLSAAHEIASKLEVGVVWINSYNLTPVEMPFGGSKDSGLGMENGIEVLREYSRVQSIYVNSSNTYDSFF